MNLSVVIVSHNTKELLRQCLKSVISDLCLVASDKKPKTLPITNHQLQATEIIVVDNGSNDGSVEMLKKTLTTNHQSPITIKLIENENNLGFARAVNQGIKEAAGETILLLNSDTQVKPESLKRLMEFEKKVRPAIIGARMLNPDETVQGSCFYLPTMGRAIKEYWFGKSGYFSKYAPIGVKPVEVETVSGGAMLISKGVIDKIGLLDERYFMYFEDFDYCRRAKKFGFKVYYLPTAEIVHEHGASGKNLIGSEEQWKRLIPSSKIYHGLLKHFLVNAVIWSGQKFQNYFAH